MKIIKIDAAATSTQSLTTQTQPTDSTSTMEEIAVIPRQIYTRDNVIQEREDIAPSQLRKKRKSGAQLLHRG